MYRDVKLKLISNKIAELVTENIKDLKIEFDAEKEVTHQALMMIYEIQSVIAFSDLNDFDMVDMIVQIFNEHGFYTGGCHDF